MKRTLPLLVASLAASCGSRSQLDGDESKATQGSRDADAPMADRCPAAVLAGAPKPMRGYCSTRDGRVRMPALHAPRVTWTATIPITDGSTRFAATGIATDASGHAYVASAGGFGGNPSLRRVDTTNGRIEWAVPSGGAPTAFLTASGLVEAMNGPPTTIVSFDPASGAASVRARLGFDFRDSADPAIGADGSFYFSHLIDAGTSHPSPVVSRVMPDGSIAWTSMDLAKLTPPPRVADVSPSVVALSRDDMVIVDLAIAPGPKSVSLVVALDPANGRMRWTKTFTNPDFSWPVIAADGSIVMIHGDASASKLVVLEPSGEVRLDTDVGRAFELMAVALDGTVLASTTMDTGVDGLIAIDARGSVVWRRALHVHEATIASNGTVLVRNAFDVTALDLSTGKTIWTLALPHPSICLSEATLTSRATIVGLQCDGTLFGAED